MHRYACVVHLLAVVLSAEGAGGAERSVALPFPASIRIESFETAKLLHAGGEAVTFRAAMRLANANVSLTSTDEPLDEAELIAEIWDEHGLEPAARVDQSAVAPAKADSGPLELTWIPPTDQLYGHRARLLVKDKFGRVLAQSAALFEVCDQWQHVMRPAASIGYTLAGEHLTDADLRRIVSDTRAAYLNSVELFAWMPSPHDLTPDSPTWKCAYYRQPERPAMSDENLKRLGQLLHDNGIKIVMYNETSVIEPAVLLPGKDPEPFKVYVDYDGDGKPNLVEPYKTSPDAFQPNPLMVADLFAEELTESVRRFDWDGILMDSSTQAFFSTADGMDRQGEQLTDLTAGQIGRRYVGAARRAVEAVKPNFRFFCQNIASSALLRHHHWREPNDQLEQVIGGYMRKHFGELFEVIDMWSAEMDTHYDNQQAYPQTYDKYAITLNVARTVSKKPVVMWSQIAPPYLGEYSPAFAVPLMSTLGAAHVAWHDHFSNYGGVWGPEKQAPVNVAQVRVNRFLLRFGRYLRSPDLAWVASPEPRIKVDAPRELFWRHTVYERLRANGQPHEVVVNLINLDTPMIRPSNADQPPHVTPQPVFPVTVLYRLPQTSGAASVSVFCLDAEDRTLRPLSLPVEIAKGWATISVPPVRSWSVLVIRHGES